MSKLSMLLIVLLLSVSSIFAQNILVSGQCISGIITLVYGGDLAGKPSYSAFGNVNGNGETGVSIFWKAAPDNVWVLAFDGQPYFQNSCNTAIPPGTANTACPWGIVSGNVCTGVDPLSISGAVTLPVTLADFTASKRNNDVLLKWKTLQEINNKRFIIQKIISGNNWLDIGSANGHALTPITTNYQFLDAAPFIGLNLYRLKQEDIDGKVSYSTTVKVDFSSTSFYTISDNPGKGIYKINMAAGADKIELTIMDGSGKILLRKNTNSGNQILDISTYAAGIYWLKVKKANQQATHKIIKL